MAKSNRSLRFHRKYHLVVDKQVEQVEMAQAKGVVAEGRTP